MNVTTERQMEAANLASAWILRGDAAAEAFYQPAAPTRNITGLIGP